MNKPFRTIEEVNDYLSGDRIKCLVCDKWYIHLGIHISRKHTISLRDYRIEFNIPLKKGLIGRKLRENTVEKSKHSFSDAKFLSFQNRKNRGGNKKGNILPELSKEKIFQASQTGRQINIAIKKTVSCGRCGSELIRSKLAISGLKSKTRLPSCKQCKMYYNRDYMRKRYIKMQQKLKREK